jgi:dienelactone hydrolase
MPPVERVELNPRTIWRRETALGSIEKLAFTAEPGADVPAYFCIPKDAKPPYRTFICLQGHSTGMHNSIAVSAEDETTPIAVEGDRDFALGCMRRGIAALCIEQRAFGQRAERLIEQPGPKHLSCYDASAHALMLGRTLIGERVFDVDRALDYLKQRGDVRMKDVGVMGNSGGGTTSMYALAVLPRVKAALLSCAFARYAESIMGVHHCICNYLPHVLNWADMGDIVGLAAPKPVVIVNGRHDPIFPLDSAKRAFAQTQRIYAAAGAGDRCRFVVGEGEHRFYADDAWPVMMELLGWS